MILLLMPGRSPDSPSTFQPFGRGRQATRESGGGPPRVAFVPE